MTRKTLFVICGIVAAGAVVTGVVLVSRAGGGPTQWRSAAVTRGDLAQVVTASGTVNPRQLVTVGTQVSGTVAKLFVDFNSPVKKGQVVALLDSTFLHAAVEDARASLARAQAQLDLAQHTLERAQALLDKGLSAQADLDQATADHKGALANRNSAQAGLDRARINLAYATITSPISGVVVNRNVDVGQTVAASFSAPTLFIVADDLTKMQVQASVDEGDIGQVRVGQSVSFSVDAYPSRAFSGTVSQVRLQPTTVQNVVSYTVMIDVDNPDRALMPGMTANATISVNIVHNALIVPSAALAFVPPQRSGGRGRDSTRARWGQGGHGRDSTGAQGARGGHGRDSTRAQWAQGGHGGDSTHAQWAQGGQAQDRGRVFILKDGHPSPVRVHVLLTSSGSTAVEGELEVGQSVIVGVLQKQAANKTQTQNPFQQSAPTGMPRRF